MLKPVVLNLITHFYAPGSKALITIFQMYLRVGLNTTYLRFYRS